MLQNGDLLRIADWGPPPRNQINHLQKITVWANNTGFSLCMGVPSSNNFVTVFCRQSPFQLL